jgi:hypothetical protein
MRELQADSARLGGTSTPLYELAWMLRARRLHHPAHMIARRGIAIPVPDDTLFVHRWVYEWGLLFEYSIAAYWRVAPSTARNPTLSVCRH